MAKLAINGGAKTVPDGVFTLWPVITDDDKKQVLESLDSGFTTGPDAPQILGAQREFAEFVGVKHCLMVNSGTAALHLAIAAAGIGPGDEVIVPSFTFLASALGVLHHNAVPVFVDIEPDTFCIDPKKIEAKITKRTRAIIPVHLHGLCADMFPIMEIAAKHNLFIIEDCAQAHGATYEGKMAGTFGHAALFSIQASKNLPTGEAGFFTTNYCDWAETANRVRLFGQDANLDDGKYFDRARPLDRNRGFESVMMGWQYMPGELPAALLRSQLRRLKANNENARKVCGRLDEMIRDIPGLTPPHIPANRVGVYHKFRIRLDPKAAGVNASSIEFRNKILAALQAEGVESCLWEVKPVPAQKNFAEHVGYGKQCPWACPLRDEPAQKTDPADYAVAQELLDNSIVIGSHTFPMIAQNMDVAEYYGNAIRKVFDNLGELFPA